MSHSASLRGPWQREGTEHSPRRPRDLALARLLLLGGAFALLGTGCVRERAPAPSPPTPGGVYRSDDGGVTLFQKVTVAGGGSLAGAHARQVEIVPATPDVLYLVAAEGLFRTDSGGDQWNALALPAASIQSVSVHPRNPQILLAAGVAPRTGRGKIWKSIDAGERWAEVYTAPTATIVSGTIIRRQREVQTVVTALSHDATAPEVVSAGTSTGGLLVSTDGGVHWQERYSFQQGVTGLKASPRTGGLLFARLADGRLARSTDGGQTVETVRLDRAPQDSAAGGLTTLPSGFGGSAADPANAVSFLATSGGPEPILVGTQSGLFGSTDGGTSWVRLQLPSSGTAKTSVVSIAESPNGRLWVASGAVLFSSEDRGRTWRAHDTKLQAPLRFVVADPTRGNRLYVVFAGN